MVLDTRFAKLGLAAVAGGFVLSSASASTIATATFDTDSYLGFKTDNRFSSEITVGPQVAVPNANFGVIEFDDLSLVSSTGSKFLVIDLEAFRTGGGPGNPPVDTVTGNATIKVVGLTASYRDEDSTDTGVDYEDASISPQGWFEAQIGNPTAAASVTATSAGLLYFDVTSVVDGWLANPASNYGFGLTVSSGQAVELGAGSGEGVASGSVAPTLSTVPEPSSLALLALGGIGLLRRRR